MEKGERRAGRESGTWGRKERGTGKGYLEDEKGYLLLVCRAQADAAKLALKADAVVIVGRVGLRVPRGSALRLGVVVVVWRVLTLVAVYCS